MEQDLAQAPGAERGQELVETLAAKAEGLGVGVVTQRDDAVFDASEIGPRRFQTRKEVAGVVGHITLAVSRGADEKAPRPFEVRGRQLVHGQHLGRHTLRCEGVLHLIGHKVRGPGHGPHQDSHRQRHAVLPRAACRLAPLHYNS